MTAKAEAVRPARAVAVVLALFVAVAQPASAGSGAGTLVVPLHVERGPYGDGRLGIDVTVGARTVRVLLDTGSAGLRLLSSAVPDGSARRLRASASGVYGSGLVLRGQEARARFAVGDSNAAEDAIIELVDGFECAQERPNCQAANGGTPEMFGLLFPGILGIGYVDPPGNRCCPNPLEALTAYGRRYIVHAQVSAPTLTLGPDPASLAAFTMIDVPHGVLPRGCLRVSGIAFGDVCGEVLFDTGTPQLVVTTTGIASAGPLPSGTTATLTVGTWSHAYAIGPATGLRLNLRRGDTNRIIVGLAALQSVDVYYDLFARRIGLLSL
jgi:hypothetical protein